jgi:hypothetical protein
VAVFAANEQNEERRNRVSLKCYRACADTYAMPSSRFHARFAVLDLVFFPDTTATNELYVIDTTYSQPGSTLLVEKTKDNIISLAVLLKAGFKVDFAVGRPDDTGFGGILYTPEGILIKLVFHDNLWHIPMWQPPSIVPPRTDLPSLDPAVKVSNYYRALDATSRDKRAAKTITTFIAALQGEGHQGPLEHETCRDDFVVTSATKVLVSLIMPQNWCCLEPFE